MLKLFTYTPWWEILHTNLWKTLTTQVPKNAIFFYTPNENLYHFTIAFSFEIKIK